VAVTQVYVLTAPNGGAPNVAGVYITLRDLIEALRLAVLRGHRALDVRIQTIDQESAP
jgi:hypothetical protein